MDKDQGSQQPSEDTRHLIVVAGRPTGVQIRGFCPFGVVDCGRLDWMRKRKSLSFILCEYGHAQGAQDQDENDDASLAPGAWFSHKYLPLPQAFMSEHTRPRQDGRRPGVTARTLSLGRVGSQSRRAL